MDERTGHATSQQIEQTDCSCSCARAAHLVSPCAACAVQWSGSIASGRLSASSLVGTLDVAPLLAQSPLFTCYCLSLLAALQRVGVLHGVKPLKALCSVFMFCSSWYRECRLRGPWAYDWHPPLPQMVRDLTSSFLIFLFLDNPTLLPDAASIATASQQAQAQANSSQWSQAHHDKMAHAHAQLDVMLSQANVDALANVLKGVARMHAILNPTHSPGNVSKAS